MGERLARRSMLSEPVQANLELAELAAAGVRDGCIEETLGVHLALELARSAPEADVRATMTTIAGVQVWSGTLAGVHGRPGKRRLTDEHAGLPRVRLKKYP